MQSNPNTLSFKQATVLDAGFLLILRKLSMEAHLQRAGIFYTDEQHQARVYEHYHDSNIIYLGNEPIGLIKLGLLDVSIHIRQFQLLPKYQGKGIGSKVLGLIKKKAANKAKPITLCVLLDNPVLSLYLRQGFEITKSDELQHYMTFR